MWNTPKLCCSANHCTCSFYIWWFTALLDCRTHSSIHVVSLCLLTFFKIQRPSNTNLFCFLPSMCSSFWQVLVLEPWFKWNRTRTNEENEHGGRGARASTDQTNLQHNGGGAGIHECGFKAPMVFFVCRAVSGIMISPVPFAILSFLYIVNEGCFCWCWRCVEKTHHRLQAKVVGSFKQLDHL